MGFSQLKDTLVAKKFWADNIHNMVTLNKSQILLQTHFPIEVADKKLTKEQFKLSLDKYFNQELRDELSKKTIDDIDAWTMYEGSTQTYMIVCYNGMIEGYDALVLNFLQYNGKWMLDGLSYQKDEVEEEDDREPKMFPAN